LEYNSSATNNDLDSILGSHDSASPGNSRTVAGIEKYYTSDALTKLVAGITRVFIDVDEMDENKWLHP
jgi:hypothetical protein